MTEVGNEVEERLQRLSERLPDLATDWGSPRVCKALIAAVRAATDLHQPATRLGATLSPFCVACGLNWPCDTITDVLAELEDL